MSVDFGAVSPRIPESDGLNAEFYRQARTGRLHLQRCRDCQHVQHPPRQLCRACSSGRLEWAPVDGIGTLYSWTVTHYPFDRGWAPAIPYRTGVVELPEGVRLVAALADGVRPRIDLPVRVMLTPAGEDFVLLSLIPSSPAQPEGDPWS